MRPAEKKPEPLQAPVPGNDALSKQAPISIAEKNIFNPDRREFPIPEKESEPLAPPPVRPQVILYGVTIAEDYQVALIANPGKPLYRNEGETFQIKLGEKVGAYKVSRISPDRITLEREGDHFDVLLFDPSKPKKRMGAKTDIKAATITSISTQLGPTAHAPSAASSSASSTPPGAVQDSKASMPKADVTPPTTGTVTTLPPSVVTPAPTSTRPPTAYPRPGPEIRWGKGPYHQ